MSDKIPTGEFIAQYIDDGDVPSDAIQSNGVDLKVGEIYDMHGHAIINNDEYVKPYRKKLNPGDVDVGVEKANKEFISGNYYQLVSGAYIVEYAETIEIPEGFVGLVMPRSRIMRSTGTVISAWWDQGYKGKGEGQLQVYQDTFLSEDARIAQITFLPAKQTDNLYDGTHQHEGLDQ